MPLGRLDTVKISSPTGCGELVIVALIMYGKGSKSTSVSVREVVLTMCTGPASSIKTVLKSVPYGPLRSSTGGPSLLGSIVILSCTGIQLKPPSVTV